MKQLKYPSTTIKLRYLFWDDGGSIYLLTSIVGPHVRIQLCPTFSQIFISLLVPPMYKKSIFLYNICPYTCLLAPILFVKKMFSIHVI